MADLQARTAEVLVCYSTSRLTRRPMDYERLIRLVLDTHVQIATVVSGAVNLSTADGRAIARVLAATDAAEAERTSGSAARAVSAPSAASRTAARSRPGATSSVTSEVDGA